MKSVTRVLIAGALAIMMTMSSCVYATPSYGTPWGALYRNPEWSNSYGRSWFAACNSKTTSYIYLEPYYSYGCGTTISYVYKSGKKSKSQKTVKSGSCRLEKSAAVSGLSHIIFSGTGYGINFSINR